MSDQVTTPSMPEHPVPEMPEVPVIPENENWLQHLLNTEPAYVWSVLVGLIASAIGVAVAFGADVSTEAQNAIYAAVASVWPVVLLVAAGTRRRAWSPTSVNRLAMEVGDATAARTEAEVMAGWERGTVSTGGDNASGTETIT